MVRTCEKWRVWKTWWNPKKMSKWNLLAFDSYTLLGLVVYCVDWFWWFFVVVPFCSKMGDFWSGEGAGKVFVKILMEGVYLYIYIYIFMYVCIYSNESINIRNPWVQQVSEKDIHIQNLQAMVMLCGQTDSRLWGRGSLKGRGIYIYIYTKIHTRLTARPWKVMAGRWISFSECLFSGAMFTFEECTLWHVGNICPCYHVL